MRKLIQLVVLFAVPAAAYAQVTDFIAVPEPETFSLLAIGAVALVLSTVRRRKY
ncbi:MAG: PEP-CTERM sorting domain-containing protein [Gammaproteobacteria bacterium]